ncbi:MAG: 30S ribosomal protein S7, partial [Actinobacteria bacterium]|nr:30S ribosomal protein S7 [Actinomycetota bacterium]
MARKGRTPKKEMVVDPIYKSKLVTEFINKILWCGKKSTAEHIVYGSFDILGKKTKESPLDIL